MRELLTDGSALEKFQRLVQLQGGDPEVIADPSKFRQLRRQPLLAAFAASLFWNWPEMST
jgi:thymidine phosphorylase